MKFSYYPEDTLILYTYNFTSVGTVAKIGRIIKQNLCDIYSSYEQCAYTTNLCTMDSDDHASIIAQVTSIEDALLHYPEYFI